MEMFYDKDFYPTPVEVIIQMLEGYSLNDKIVLEPSAGKGDIVDYLTDNGATVIACEKHPQLKKIVIQKCNLIADDFLTVTSDKISHIDMIVMNPPFSADEHHIMHAWNIAPEGCHIVALCNANTIEKPTFRTRAELKTIVEAYGTFENIGGVFSQAERSTGVDIGLIRIHKPGQEQNEFEGFFLEDNPAEEQFNGIMPYNFIRDLVNRYVEAVKLYDKQLELAVQMNTLTSQFYKSSIAFQCVEGDKPKHRAEYKKDLQKSAWNYIFKELKMEKYATKGLKEDINKFVEKQQQIPFTMRNIYKMLEIVIGTQSQRMDKALLEVFDKLTTHYHDNRYNVEGWKTNSHYLVGKKFILPSMIDYCSDDKIKVAYGRYNLEIIEDFQKALCYITGKNYDKMKTLYDFVNSTPTEETAHKTYDRKYVNRAPGKWHEWNFFRFKAFKKGTIHFEFLDENVWALFNQHISRIKGYPLFEHKK